MSDKPAETDVPQVFATAAPISRDQVVETETAETTTKKNETAETRKSTGGGSDRTAGAAGVPPWHLSLTLGLVIVLVGGVLLWMWSPLAAILVVGGLIVLGGLALVARRLTVKRAARRSQAGETGGSQAGGNRRRQSSPKEGSEAGRSRRRSQSQNRETPGRARSRETETRGRPKSQNRETGDRNQSRRQSQPPRGTAQPVPPRNPRGRTPQAAAGPSGGRPTAPGGPRPQGPGRTPTAGITCGGGNTPTPVRPTITKPDTPRPTKPDAVTDKPKNDKPQTVATPPGPRPPVPSVAKTEKTEDTIAWPNVDLDHYKPVKAHQMPRITIPRKAVKLPPIYHRKGEPSWPTDDPDSVVVIPPQRDRRGSVATPDMLTSAQREQHYTNASATARRLADEKDRQAFALIAQAGELDGMEGMEDVREQKLVNAHRAAYDGQVRAHLAAIYASWAASRN